MAKKGGSAVYRVTEVIGTSAYSWEDAARNAVKTAASTLRDLRIAEIDQARRARSRTARSSQFRARLSLSFKYDARRSVHRGRAHQRRRAARGFPRAPALADGARPGRRGVHRAPRRRAARIPLPAATRHPVSRPSPKRRRVSRAARRGRVGARRRARARGDRERPPGRSRRPAASESRGSTSRSATTAGSSSA